MTNGQRQGAPVFRCLDASRYQKAELELGALGLSINRGGQGLRELLEQYDRIDTLRRRGQQELHG